MIEPTSAEQRKQVASDKAGGICEYCRSRKDFSPDPFAVEHIYPCVRGGTDALDNLALSCHGCNGHKYAKSEALDPVNGERIPLFHPRRQQWREQFEWTADFTLVVGITPTGRATVEPLQINRPGVINLRRILHAAGLHPPEEWEDDLQSEQQ